MAQNLRPYQADLVARVRQRVAEGKRIIVMQSPTGAGKTSVFCHIAARAVEKDKRVLTLVHRRKLVDQIADRMNQFGVEVGIIMRGEHNYGAAKVQVASRDTVTSRHFDNEWLDLPPADLLIVDEAHHAADPKSDHRRIIDQYPNAVVLLVTATPVGPDGKGLGPWAQAIECSVPTSQLIAEGHLCPVKCFAPDRKKARAGKYKRGVAGDLVESWKQYGKDMPTVLFCSRVKHSIDAVEAYNAAGIPARHVDADTPDDERDAIYAGIGTGEFKIVSNVGIIGEGVDLPCLGCCQLYLDVGGRVKFIQAVGRIMRPFPGKEHAVVIDHAGSVFRHGFPDEDQEWTLEGNVDADFAKAHADGKTEKAFYCKQCELAYHGSKGCPQCGKMPSKPPRSMFAPPPMDNSGEILTEAERGERDAVYGRDEKIRHWLRCLAVAANKGGNFKMASAIYKQKYSEWPENSFPCLPGWSERGRRVGDVYPKFVRRRTG